MLPQGWHRQKQYGLWRWFNQVHLDVKKRLEKTKCCFICTTLKKSTMSQQHREAKRIFKIYIKKNTRMRISSIPWRGWEGFIQHGCQLSNHHPLPNLHQWVQGAARDGARPPHQSAQPLSFSKWDAVCAEDNSTLFKLEFLGHLCNHFKLHREIGIKEVIRSFGTVNRKVGRTLMTREGLSKGGKSQDEGAAQ